MTANPDSALRQALDALAPFAKEADRWDDNSPNFQPGWSVNLTVADLRRAREAHALITEALQRGEK